MSLGFHIQKKIISGHKKAYLSVALLRAYQPKSSVWHGNASCRLEAIDVSFFFPLSITLDPHTASHILFFLEDGNSENAKYLIYFWLKKRSLHELKLSLLFVTVPAKILKLSQTFLDTGIVLAAPASLKSLNLLILTCPLA